MAVSVSKQQEVKSSIGTALIHPFACCDIVRPRFEETVLVMKGCVCVFALIYHLPSPTPQLCRQALAGYRVSAFFILFSIKAP